MKGNIFCDQKCPICKGIMKYDPRRAGCYCLSHKNIAATGRFRVGFGKEINKRFEDLREAEQFLNGIRFKTSEGTFDVRDYRTGNPLGFDILADKWLDVKRRQSIKPTTLSNLRTDIFRAIDFFGNRNIKTISNGDIEDFIFHNHQKERGGPISDKTRASIRSTINQFFTWVCRREKIDMPDIPHVKFELKWRKIVSLDVQQKIIEEIRRISFHINPRIWLAISILSHNQNVRPGELIKCAEGDVMPEYGRLMVKYPKEGYLKAKDARLNAEELALIQSFPRALPDVPLFRHIEGISGVTPGQRFHPKLLNNWWKRACKKLGVKDVTLYPGVKHSVMTAISKELSPEQIRRGGSQHASKAMERYMIPNQHEADLYQAVLARMQGKADVVDIKSRKNK
jgi:integrase